MARKGRRFQPGPPRRAAREGGEISGDTFLIVVEGEGTEIEYFEGLRDQVLRRKIFEIEVHHPPVTDPVGLVHAAIDSKAARVNASKEGMAVIFDQVWVLVDRERQHCERREQIPRARRLAEANGIFVAVSNPCFELWLMLHYRDRPGPFRDGEHCRKMLKKDHIRGYKKTELPLAELLEREALRKAMKHAQQCEEHHRACDGDGNPSSEVYKLLRALNDSARGEERLF